MRHELLAVERIGWVLVLHLRG
ncbi:hypothetical protein BN873_360051 [Candidatus Competibacter denitrificans Run_A_D11]|uniref:Uncharacterized protein n=1 Tax=Candidatus Competibacter denitrificans Run_A_D11 TaxID=1400863 RepID=W6M5D2_9GAMM|nr:hypothetical protein BN873_360051 [Candidatus Competibacter denitrificans Run_A_D11]